jgi:hypothetical protein
MVGFGVSYKFLSSFNVWSRWTNTFSKSHHCANTNVVHKAAKSAPGTGTVSVYYVCTTRHVERKNKFGPRALVITRGQTVPGDKAASRGHTAGFPLATRTGL